jgi:hypothetical protein
VGHSLGSRPWFVKSLALLKLLAMVMVSWKLERSLVEVIRFWLDAYSGIGSVRGMQFQWKYRGLQGGSLDRHRSADENYQASRGCNITAQTNMRLQPQYDGII